MIKTLMSLLRKFSIGTLYFSACFIIAVVLFLQSNIPQDTLKQIVETQLEKQIGHHVSVGSISGNLFKTITLNDISLFLASPEDSRAFIKTLTFKLSLPSIILNRGNIVYGLTSINISDASLFLNRLSDGSIELSNLYVPKKTHNAPLSLNTQINIQNLSLFFRDEKGWGTNANKTTSFQEQFLLSSITVDLNTIGDSSLSAIGTLGSNNSDMMCSATGNILKQEFTLNFAIPSLSLDHWGDYVLPSEFISIDQNTISLTGKLSHLPDNHNSKIPFIYDLSFDLNQNRLSLSFIPSPINTSTGTLNLNNRDEDITLSFKNLKGDCSEIAFSGKGNLLLKQKQINISLSTQETDVLHLTTLFPSLEFLSLNGRGKATVNIKGPLDNPEVFGHFTSPSLAILSHQVDHLYLDYLFKDETFYFTSHTGELFNSPLKSKGIIDLKEDTPFFKIQAHLEDLLLDPFITLTETQRIGTADVTCIVRGYPDNYIINTTLNSPDIVLFNQDIPSLNIRLSMNEDKITSVIGQASVNDQSDILHITSIPSSNNLLLLDLSGENVAVYDIGTTNRDVTGSVSINGAVSLLNQSPFTVHEATVTASSQNLIYNNQLYSNVFLDTQFQDNTFVIHSLILDKEDEKTSIDGYIKDENNEIIHLTFNKLNVKKNDILQKFIPEKFKPFEGLLSGEVWFSPTQKKSYTLNYGVNGHLTLENAILQGQSFGEISVTFDSKEALTLHEFKLSKQHTNLNITGSIDHDSFNLSIANSSIDLSNFKPLLYQYGNVSGIVNLDGSISGSIDNPSFELNIKAQDLNSLYVYLKELEGKLSYKNKVFSLHNIHFDDTHSDFTINGEIAYSPVDHTPVQYDLDLDIKYIDINPFSKLIQNVFFEYQLFTNMVPTLKNEMIPNANVTTSLPNEYVLSFDITNNSLFSIENIDQALSYFSTIKSEHDSFKLPQKEQNTQSFSGTLQGNLKLKSQEDRLPKLSGKMLVSQLKLPYFETDQCDISFANKRNNIKFDINMTDGVMTGRAFNYIKTTGSLSYGGILNIDSTNIHSKGQLNTNILYGTYPLYSLWSSTENEDPINLTLQLNKSNVNLLSFIHPSIQSISNDGDIILHLEGTTHHPLLSTEAFELKNTIIKFDSENALFDEVRIPDTKLSLSKNQLTVPETTILWKNKGKQQTYSSLVTQGTVSLGNFSINDPHALSLNIDMHTAPSKFLVNIPEIYTGEINMEAMSLKGVYTIPISQEAKDTLKNQIDQNTEIGPIISGRLKLKNGNFELPKYTKKTYVPTYGFNIKIDVGKDVFMSGSFLGSGSLAAISVDLELEETIAPLKVTGTINNLNIDNKVVFKDGNINIFNRQFTLLSYSDQAQYSSQVEGELLPNDIHFDYVPIINLSSVTVIEPPNQDTSTSNSTLTDKEYSHIVAKIRGPITDLSMIRFDYYTSNSTAIKNNNDINYVQAYYISNNENQSTVGKSDRAELLKLLLPELFQDASDQLLTEYGESRVNLLFKRSVLRPLEKQIANGIGLYDLQIDYNLGSDLFNSSKNKSLGINMMQQLFTDQLYLRVKTDIELETATQGNGDNVGISEVELTYYLLKNFSINYANIKGDIRTDTNFKPKVSLKFSHDF